MAAAMLAPDPDRTYSVPRKQGGRLALPANQRRAIADLLDRLRAEYASVIEQVFLYGSGARGDAQLDSDTDLLIVLSAAAPRATGEAIRATAADVSAVWGCDLHLLLFDPAAMMWHRRGSSLWLNVQREGIDLWRLANDEEVDLGQVALREEQPVILSSAQHDEIRIHMEHAREDLTIAATLMDAGHYRVAIARCYYAAFYAISALLLTKGVVRAKHGAIRAAVHQYLVRAGVLTAAQGRLFDQLQHERQEADYDMLYAPGESIAEERLTQSRMLVEVTDMYLKNHGYL